MKTFQVVYFKADGTQIKSATISDNLQVAITKTLIDCPLDISKVSIEGKIFERTAAAEGGK